MIRDVITRNLCLSRATLNSMIEVQVPVRSATTTVASSSSSSSTDYIPVQICPDDGAVYQPSSSFLQHTLHFPHDDDDDDDGARVKRGRRSVAAPHGSDGGDDDERWLCEVAHVPQCLLDEIKV